MFLSMDSFLSLFFLIYFLLLRLFCEGKIKFKEHTHDIHDAIAKAAKDDTETATTTSN